MMNWDELSQRIYYRDGSLRDIYIHNTTIEDWKTWINYVNENYTVQFFDRSNNNKVEKIEIEKIVQYWNKENEDGVFASIDVDGIKIMCYFTIENEIETDFTPGDIKNIGDHNNLVAYLKDCSRTLQKTMVVTAEMQEEKVLIKVTNNTVDFF